MGLNFEDPNDKNLVSTVSFGYIDYNQIEGGEDGFQYYNNIGLNYWAVLMDDVQYDKQGLGMNTGGKMAIIDSGNTSIQIPASQFEELKTIMQKQDNTIKEQEVDGQTILVSQKKCDYLANVFGDLQFML